MLYYALIFLLVAVVAGVLGFAGIAGTASSIAKVLFVVFLVLFVISLLRGRRRAQASPFNIVKRALTLRDFTRAEIAELYGQHTSDTGQAFAESAIDRAFYWTAGQPWLVILMGFLQRVLNSGGRVVREMAAGSGRLDLCVEYGDHRYPLELKVRRGERTVPDGLRQLARYLDTLGEPEGWLIVFDQRPDGSWKDKISWTTETVAAKTIHLVGC